MRHIIFIAGKEIIQANDIVASVDQSFTPAGL